MADTKNYGIRGVGANIELGKRGNTIESNSGNVILKTCLLYTSPSPRDATLSRMPSSA